MAVGELTVLRAWQKSGGRCSCMRMSHNHSYVRCSRVLNYDLRDRPGEGGWVAYFHKSPTTGTVLDCEILCMSCHLRAMAGDPPEKKGS